MDVGSHWLTRGPAALATSRVLALAPILCRAFQTLDLGTRKMTQGLRAPVVLLEDQSSVPSIHTEKLTLVTLISLALMPQSGLHRHTHGRHSHKHIRINKNENKSLETHLESLLWGLEMFISSKFSGDVECCCCSGTLWRQQKLPKQ